ncbi:hypothetical protein PV08_11057 [Exophiala spinifera]|uniref:Xaa-Pro dipeptidyl-peptidase C-terminal domain-containing protein n=1 Tax=Exophiala spinifera TaxID=91928 RepID=A0A0D1ZAQ5_9EURO|nr:uncharacterized protein PV08_11057 [Exophiala spinifera]KIW10097.1 hypothetical protein PV08_11057 [Exophiala spinifera]
MAGRIRDIKVTDEVSFPYIFEQNVSVPLKSASTQRPENVIRCNVYRPRTGDAGKVPVLVTYGPYGKDIPYRDFHPKSFAEVNPKHKSEHSCWETPDPHFWTSHGYAVVRADERGLGQSPGFLDTMSRGTSEAFFDVVEWAAEQSWSSGKVGLLGISYYGGSQWRVAARRPRGLAAIIPWEGMSDYYRDRCRQGGIFSNGFIKFWWDRQVITNQYGRPGRSKSQWGPDTIEGDLSEEELAHNRRDQNVDNAENKYLDDEYYASRDFNLGDIQVPVLSVANWGGNTLHLRGNVEGFFHAGSELKYLRFISGRHDLPFYYDEEVAVQQSFLDAFLKGDDREGWSQKGKLPQVNLLLRKGNIGVNDAEAEKGFQRRTETEWPIARTQYSRFYLTPSYTLQTAVPNYLEDVSCSYLAPSFDVQNPHKIQFVSEPFTKETEITGHITAHLNVSVEKLPGKGDPSEIDLFVTMRHVYADGKEVFYTGTAGDPVPLCKGWLRVSLRKVNEQHPWHRSWLPRRDYLSTDVETVDPGVIYPVDVEIWPTNVVTEIGSRLIFEVASGDTQGAAVFTHNHPTDRPLEKLQGVNHIWFGPGYENYVTLPIIPERQ